MSAEITRSAALEKLVGAVQALSEARSIAAIAVIVRSAAREITGADGSTFVLRDVDQCFYFDEDAIAPLWKGRRFPMSNCVSGWAMRTGRSVVIPDIYADPRVPADAYRPTFVKSMAMVPIRRAAPIGAIGNYWATQREPTTWEVEMLQALADSTSVAMENAQLYSDLQDKIDALSRREATIREQRDTLDVFARSLAHDLKDPAYAVYSFARLLTQRKFPEETRDKYINYVHEASARMAMLLDAVFDYTQLNPDQLHKERFNLADAVSLARHGLAALIDEREATLTCGAMPEVYADITLISQVLEKLIGNAIAHSPRPVAVHVDVEDADGATRIVVRDSGPGFAPEHCATVFEPFRRLTSANGHAGMGLAVSRKIIDYHGGRIGCKSECGAGATFFFTLPGPVDDAAAMRRSA